MSYIRKHILQYIFLCAFLSVPLVVAEHQLTHLYEHTTIEHSETCCHSAIFNSIIESSLFEFIIVEFKAVTQFFTTSSNFKITTLFSQIRAPPKD